MPRASRGVLLAVTMALLLAGPLVAQSNTGNVYGNVIDEQGGTIPGGTATLIGPSVAVPYANRSLLLGTWQRIVLVELNGPRQRAVHLSAI